MGYVESLLASGERIVRKAHQHWFIMVWRARWAVLGLLVGLVLVILRVLNPDSQGPLWGLLGWVTVILIILGLVSLGWGWFQYRNEEYVITNRRLIHSEGVINKKASDSSLEKINDAVLVESVFGRMFGFGNLEVLTASESGIDDLHMLRDAKEFKKAMLEAKHELEIELTRPTMPPLRAGDATPAGGAGVVPGAAEPMAPTDDASLPAAAAAPAGPAAAATAEIDTATEVADALARLGGLRDQGIITPEEFEAKKAELLGRL